MFLQVGLLFITLMQAPETKTAGPARKGGAPQPKVFSQTCTNPSYPTPAPATPPAIDSQCGLAGSGGVEAAQNSLKNNFCAAGTPQTISIPDLANLQTEVANDPTINFGDEGTPTRPKGPTVNRAPLQKLGEGKLVSLQGYVLFARSEGPESVNCGTSVPNTAPFHDVHIEIVDSSAVTDECAGVVAEMIPHHRPDTWTAGAIQAVARAKQPVRVTGQLFFDSSHFPCQGGQGVRENPKRISLWEIHPIYTFETCPGSCNSSSGWVPLDEWMKAQKTK